ncbi:MAG: hypothetical protein AAY43_08270 [Methanosarcina sp. 795]|nr:MAG: hypothetical protein AAY43_08270 [Methanosarcina sp. 795]
MHSKKILSGFDGIVVKIFSVYLNSHSFLPEGILYENIFSYHDIFEENLSVRVFLKNASLR